jgi:hypothetical protein
MTDASRKAAERKRKREAGLVPVELWVPADRVEQLRQIAQEMRDRTHRHSAAGSAGGRGDGEG